MIHPSRETVDQEIEQQTRLVRGLMAALSRHRGQTDLEFFQGIGVRPKASARHRGQTDLRNQGSEASGSDRFRASGPQGIGVRPI